MDNRNKKKTDPRPANASGKPSAPVTSDRARAVGLLLAVVVLVAGFAVGCLGFLRPTVSEKEKRELTPFPALTWDAFISGEWTSQVSLWYSDTFPAREKLLRMNDFVRSLYGIGGESISSGNQVGEVIDTGETFVWETDPPEEPGSEQGSTDTETETVKLPEGDVGEIMEYIREE